MEEAAADLLNAEDEDHPFASNLDTPEKTTGEAKESEGGKVVTLDAFRKK